MAYRHKFSFPRLTSLGSLQSYFEENGVEIAEADFERITEDTKETKRARNHQSLEAYRAIEQNDDVQRIN